MSKIAGAVLLIGIAVSLNAQSSDTTGSFAIKGRLIPYVATDADGAEGLAVESASRKDLSAAKVVVSRWDSDTTLGVGTIELASGNFVDGILNLQGEIDQPTDVQISVDVGSPEPLILDVVVAPDAEVSFVLKEWPAPAPAQIELLGSSRMAKDPTLKFSIFGDLSSIDLDMEGAIVEVMGGEYDENGEFISLNFGSVMLDDGKFVVEAEVDEPRVINTVVLVMAEREYTQFRSVVEPGANIEVVADSPWLDDIHPVAGSGKHFDLLEIWRQNEEYVTTKNQYREAYREYQEESNADLQTSSDDTDESPAVTDSNDSRENGTTPRHVELKRQLSRFRYDFLEGVASNAADPIDTLLALELGAYWGKEEALPIYDRLAKTLSRDLVVRRVTSDRNFHARHLASVGIDKSLAIGKRVPEFNLPDVNGAEHSLSDILEANEVVFVDFWASWCGPCIESIPALKEVYGSYKQYGLEVVSISIDENAESWVERSEELELPWINLGELKDFEGEVATSYGVTFIPKGYLVDENGIIIQKNLTPEQLGEYLDAVSGDEASPTVP